MTEELEAAIGKALLSFNALETKLSPEPPKDIWRSSLGH
jgi:hypothetical protein